MNDVDAAREALHEAVHHTVLSARRCKGCFYTKQLAAFEAAIRAEAEGLDDVCSPYYERGWEAGHERGRAEGLDEARVAIETIRPVWLSGPDDKSVNLGQVLAAIDALREDADKP